MKKNIGPPRLFGNVSGSCLARRHPIIAELVAEAKYVDDMYARAKSNL